MKRAFLIAASLTAAACMKPAAPTPRGQIPEARCASSQMPEELSSSDLWLLASGYRLLASDF